MRLLVLLCLLAPLAASGQSCPSPLAEGDWSDVDAYALAATPTHERSIADLARYLRRAGRSDGARIRAAYRWTADRIAYDVEALTGRRPQQSADTTFATRRGVCEGYARLMVALLREMGIEAEFVGGWAFPRDGTAAISPDGLHAWVIAKAGRDWILSDPTWGSGYVARGAFHRRFNPSWFAPPPNEFARTHIPAAERWQLLATPLSLSNAVARVSPEPVCLRGPADSARGNRLNSRVVAADDGPPWQVQSEVRFRLLSAVPAGGYRAGSTADVRVEVENAASVAVFDGSILNRELRASGDVWSGRVRVGQAPLRIGVKTDAGGQWRIVASVKVQA